MTAPTNAQVSFDRAARRHHADAVHLCQHQRHVSADHLAGFAAECALKAILTGFLGAGLSSGGIPVRGQTEYRHHLPKLWGQLATVATGRAGAQFLAFVSGTNPFHAWDVSDRYGDGSLITAQRAWTHVSAAGRILRMHQAARLAGAVP